MLELTEVEKAFIEALFDPDVKGSPKKAAQKVGYTGSPQKLHKKLSEHVIKAAQEHMAVNQVEFVFAMNDIIDDPTIPGTETKLKAILAYFDRGGLVKREKMEVEHKVPDAILVLPAKNID